jgi:hypothetical protein
VRLFGPEGCYEHEPLAVVAVDAAILNAVGATITELVSAVQGGARSDVTEFVDDWADERGTSAEARIVVTTPGCTRRS